MALLFVNACAKDEVLNTKLQCPPTLSILLPRTTPRLAKFTTIWTSLHIIPDGLQVRTTAPVRAPGGTTLQIYTDSTASIRELLRVNNSALSSNIRDILDTYLSPLQISWVNKNTPARTAADSASHPFVPRPLPLLKSDAQEQFLQSLKWGYLVFE